jgi:hypothetical protein
VFVKFVTFTGKLGLVGPRPARPDPEKAQGFRPDSGEVQGFIGLHIFVRISGLKLPQTRRS